MPCTEFASVPLASEDFQIGMMMRDFEKGEADAAKDALNVIRIAAECLRDVVLQSEKPRRFNALSKCCGSG